MVKKNKEIKLMYRYSSISVQKFSLYDVSEFNTKNDELIEYQTNFEVRVFDDSEEIGILTTVRLNIIEINELFCELKVLSKFQVKPFEKIIIKKSEGSFDIPDGLLLNCSSIVLGTIRGILHEKLKGTVLQNEILPIINIDDLVKEKN